MAIKAVIFDLDDTLVVEQASAQDAFLAACALVHKRYDIDPTELCQTVREKARELWHRSPARPYCVSIGISSWEGLWARFYGDEPNLKILREWAPIYRRESWDRALAEHGVDNLLFADELAAVFQKERRVRHIVYLDVEPVLKDLREKYKLGLVTNGAPDLQREKLRGSKLGAFFDVVIISGEVGIGKPDPRIFNLVCERLNVGSETAVVVGDTLGRDISGAQRAGIRAIWLNRDNRERNGSVEPDHEVESLSELGEYLSCLE
ncbi:MAG: HAD family hydrolase [Deltaproteobacteria bacterium]|nr:HAD family hydrolase [Deltaproteobacteria bacterium]